MGNASSQSSMNAVLRDLRGALGELFTGGKLNNQFHMPVEVAFSLIGYVAKADSIVTSHEAEFVNSLMNDLNLPTQGRAIANAAFERGKARKLDVEHEAKRFLAVYPRGSDELNRLFDALLRTAAADGRIFPRERKVLEEISAALGFSNDTMNARLETFTGDVA